MQNCNVADFLDRSEILLGKENIARLAEASVCLCGLGGVGSYAAEALARSGIGRLKLIDFDNVDISNINRQLLALHSTIGQNKVELVKSRILDINPVCSVEIIKNFLNAENAAELIGAVDYCVDAIDSVQGKIAIIKHCMAQGIGIVSVMGTGNKLAPELLQINDISQTFNCPLAKAVRLALRKDGIETGVKVVFSTETPHAAAKKLQDKSVIGSCSFVPSAAGLMAASVVIRSLCISSFQQ